MISSARIIHVYKYDKGRKAKWILTGSYRKYALSLIFNGENTGAGAHGIA